MAELPSQNSPSPLPAQPQTSGLAIASLVLSCVGIFFGLTLIPEIVCGHIARSEIRKNPHLTGDGLAHAGLVIGYILLVIFVLLAALSFLWFTTVTVMHPR